jgi:predicted O-methyltransferase YrrM
MSFEDVIARIEHQANTLVWWSPDQIARNEHVANDPAKGERPWSVPHRTGVFLHDMVLRRKPRTILELGTSIGYSTAWLAHAAQTYGGHVYTIEKQPHKYDIAQENIAEAGLSHVVSFFKSDIGDLLHRIDLIAGLAPIDMVFLDADRGHYHEYFPLVKNYLSSQVVIVADNAGNMANRMQPFFDLLAREGWDYAVHNFDNGILVATPPTIPVPNKEPGDPF